MLITHLRVHLLRPILPSAPLISLHVCFFWSFSWHAGRQDSWDHTVAACDVVWFTRLTVVHCFGVSVWAMCNVSHGFGGTGLVALLHPWSDWCDDVCPGITPRAYFVFF